MAVLTSFDTQSLTRDSLQLVARPRPRPRWLTAVMTFTLLLVVIVTARNPDSVAGLPLQLLSLRQDQAQLQSDLERTRLDLRMERATRAELERQIQALSEQVAELNQQLEFVNSRAARQSAAVKRPRPTATRQEG